MSYNIINQSDKSVSIHIKRASSQKIKELYQQFENLKSRITNSNRRKMQTSVEKSSNLKNKDNSIEVRRQVKMYQSAKVDPIYQHSVFPNHLYENNNFDSNSIQRGRDTSKEIIALKYTMRKIIQNFTQFQIDKFEREFQEKMTRMQRKLRISEQTIKQIKNLMIIKKYKVKKHKLGESNKSFVFLNEQKQYLKNDRPDCISKLIQQYEEKIKKIVNSYEQKISEISFQYDKDRQTYSSTIKNVSKGDSKTHERELLTKQNVINQLKLQNSKLRRVSDQLRSSNDMHLSFIAELQIMNQKLKEKNKETHDFNGQVDLINQEKANEANRIKEDNQKLQNLLKQKCMVIEKLMTNNGRLSIDKIQFKEEMQDQNKFISLPQIHKPIEIISPKNDHFFTQLDQIGVDQKSLKQFQLTKSLIIQPKRKKSMFEDIKKLEVEADLMSEQNKHLKTKKDFFEQQLKNTQLDQQRFTQQNLLLKGQIRRLNTMVKILDQIIFQYLKQGTVDEAKTHQLGIQIKSKPLFLQKLSKRQKSKAK